MKATRVISVITALSFCCVGCSTVPTQYASKPTPIKPMVTLKKCDVMAIQLYNVTAVGDSFWNGDCIKGVSQGDGLAVWQADNKPVARYVGGVSNGIPHSPTEGATYVSAVGSYKGYIENGKVTFGVTTFPSGDRFEGSYSMSENVGVLKKKDGSVIAGRFVGKKPVGRFFYRDVGGAPWYAHLEGDKIVLEARIRQSIDPLTGLIVSVLGVGLAVVFLGGVLLVGGMAAAAVAAPAPGLVILLV